MMQKNNETTICRLCLEPVTNFICPDCLLDSVQKWAAARSTNPFQIRVLLAGKHADVKRMLSHESNRAFCVSCKGEVDEIACPCCYLYEMHSAIKSFEPGLSGSFERDFNFDLVVHHNISQVNLWESMHGRLLAPRSFRPVVITDKVRGTDMSSCENCDIDSDYLSEVDGHWLCESCRDEVLE